METRSLAFSADGASILIPHDNTAILLHVESAEKLRVFQFSSCSDVVNVAYSLKGDHVILASLYHIVIIETDSGQQIGAYTIGDGGSIIESASISADGKRVLVSSTFDGFHSKIFSVDTGDEIARFGETLHRRNIPFASISYSWKATLK